MKFVCSSDTHGKHAFLKIPEGDVFLFAGDMSDMGREGELLQFNRFLQRLPHQHKVVVNGTHDIFYEFDHGSLSHVLTHAIYLENTETQIDGIRIWGASWNPRRLIEMQAQEDGASKKNKWELIPSGIDIVITHEPPFGHGDLTASGKHVGSKELLKALRRVTPKYHVFGHVHEGYGVSEVVWENTKTICINCSAIIGFTNELKPPIVFDL